MGSINNHAEREVARIFNSTVAGWAIGAAWELGILDEVRDHEKLHPQTFASQHDLDLVSTEGLITTLVVVDILERDGDGQGDLVVAGKLFDEAYRAKSQFHWLSLGSGTLFSRMQCILRRENRKGKFYTRDPAAIAYACRDIDAPGVLDLQQSWSGAESKSESRAVGIGIDLAGPSLKFAAAEAAKRGYGDRLSFIEGDARALKAEDDFAEIDLLTCFMMGHDFWPRSNCVAALRRLRENFPKVRRFLLGDSTRTLLGTKGSERAAAEANTPVFPLGFELGHAMMGTYLPSIEEWEGSLRTAVGGV
ncbi:hypothetical protein ONS95_003239 [Cadophora gregata]|uniref:uncharacterized protein n=1 Tax=Cadophora gregata TaxID=51156 RepID=UPI0026DBC22E|nr:uncharacterized protein ONS95_003239 [Cadophora gregata]KAK0108435.1 hypothetical protein ONS95_003239 [Cadophora gregata]KAK0108972.1 hypothetical protein ONS96_002810 [Cadophora gregata f. sp. sojae]